MKSLLISALCASTMLSAVPAQAQRHDRQPAVRDHRDQRGDPHFRGRGDRIDARSWRRGDRFDRRYARNYAVIDHRRYRGLRPPPRGYHYVRSGNDAVLVGIATGIVAAIVANAVR